jgi:hypothetical protein
MTAVDTDELIQDIAASATPVRPLPPPWLRTAAWLALSIPYLALVMLIVSPNYDLSGKLTDVRFLIEQTAALTTAVAAAAAAFAMTVPGYGRKWLLLPVLPFAVWLASLGLGCLEDWRQFGSEGLSLRTDWDCFPYMVLVGAIPALAIALMLRRGAPLNPHAAAALGGLAAAGLGDFGLRLFHAQDVSIMVLVWHVGTVVVLAALAGWAGSALLNWRSRLGAARRKSGGRLKAAA